MLTIFVISDATGETAERMVRAALVQFENAETQIIRRGHIRTAPQVHAIVKQAATCGGIIVHTLVSDELRDVMLAEARQHNVDSMDLMGPVLDRLAYHLQLTPQEKPGLFKQLVAKPAPSKPSSLPSDTMMGCTPMNSTWPKWCWLAFPAR